MDFTDDVLALRHLEPSVCRLRSCYLDIDTPHHGRALRALDAKRLAIVILRYEKAALDLCADPPLQTSLASVDEMVALARWIVVWEGARSALRVACIAEVLDCLSGLALLRRWRR